MEIGRKKSETSQPTSTKNKKYQNTCKVNLQTKKKKKNHTYLNKVIHAI